MTNAVNELLKALGENINLEPDRWSIEHLYTSGFKKWIGNILPSELLNRTVKEAVESTRHEGDKFSLSITNQRETVVVWNRNTGKPIYNAVVWQCQRGEDICNDLKQRGYTDFIRQRSGLIIDPYFAASGAKWILDNVDGARTAAKRGELVMGTIDTWLVSGRVNYLF